MTRLLTTAEAAQRLRVGCGWVREHSRDLGAIRIGHERYGELRIPEAGLDAYLERRRLQAAVEPQTYAARRKRNDVPLLPLPKGAA